MRARGYTRHAWIDSAYHSSKSKSFYFSFANRNNSEVTLCLKHVINFPKNFHNCPTIILLVLIVFIMSVTKHFLHIATELHLNYTKLVVNNLMVKMAVAFQVQ